MTLAQARALLPEGPEGVIVEPHEPTRDLAALEALARWALRFSPLVAVDPPDGLLIDSAGCGHLFGGAAGLVDRLAETVGGASGVKGAAGLGFAVRVAAAPTLVCAWALARFGAAARVVVAAGGTRRALEPLPVAALNVEPQVAEALAEVGIDRIGQLLPLSRKKLAARFGRALLLRLDQALGRMPESIDPVRDLGPPMVECVFAGPVTQPEAIQLAMVRLVGELVGALARRECGVRKLEVQLDRADLEPWRQTLALSRPSRDGKHLRSLLAPRLESMNMGFGVERMSLVARRTGRLPHTQIEQWGACALDTRGRERALGELLDALGHRLGHGRVLRGESADSHLPEKTVRFHPAGEKGTVPFSGQEPAWQEGKHSEKGTVPFFGDRPALLFSRPEPITVIALTPEGPPVWFRWRSIEARITASAGPERIATPWWTHRQRGGLPRSLTRDYFKVQDEQGRWLWIFRILETGGWFVHGLWA